MIYGHMYANLYGKRSSIYTTLGFGARYPGVYTRSPRTFGGDIPPREALFILDVRIDL